MKIVKQVLSAIVLAGALAGCAGNPLAPQPAKPVRWTLLVSPPSEASAAISRLRSGK